MAATNAITVAIITVSDRCFNGETKDDSGPALKFEITQGLIQGAIVTETIVVGEDEDSISHGVMRYCDKEVNLVITTGGTGPGKKYFTSNALSNHFEIVYDGYFTETHQTRAKEVPLTTFNRNTLGVINKSLIVCLPGDLRGAVCGLRALAIIIPHAVDFILDNRATSDTSLVEITKNTELLTEISSKVIVPENEADHVRESPYPLVTMDVAFDTLKSQISPLSVTSLSSMDALGHILAEDVTSWESLPPVATSMKDGYAIKKGATNAWKVVRQVPLGSNNLVLGLNEVMRVSTGSPVPEGADYVVPIENTTLGANNKINITVMPKVDYSDIRLPGSDIKPGVVVMRKNQLVKETEVGLLAAIGQADVNVIRKPVVAVMSTGNEIQDPWETMADCKVRDSSRPMLLKLLESWRFKAIDLGLIRNDPNLILRGLLKGYDEADVIITTEGMSMGQRDFMKDVLQTDLKATLHFGRLNMKPGESTGFATLLHKRSKKYWFGLPINAASAFITSNLLVLPSLRLMSGWNEKAFLHRAMVNTTHNAAADPERVQFVRARLDFKNESGQLALTVTPYTDQQSNSLIDCLDANCLVEIKTDLYKGYPVVAHLLPNI